MGARLEDAGSKRSSRADGAVTSHSGHNGNELNCSLCSPIIMPDGIVMHQVTLYSARFNETTRSWGQLAPKGEGENWAHGWEGEAVDALKALAAL